MQFAQSRILDAFSRFRETGRKAPAAFMGRPVALDQKNLPGHIHNGGNDGQRIVVKKAVAVGAAISQNMIFLFPGDLSAAMKAEPALLFHGISFENRGCEQMKMASSLHMVINLLSAPMSCNLCKSLSTIFFL